MTNPESRAKWIIFCSCILLLTLTVCLLWEGVSVFSSLLKSLEFKDRETESVLQDLGRRLDISPSRDGVANYLYSKIQIGMTRSQVYHQAELVSQYGVTPLYAQVCRGRPYTEKLHTELLFLHVGNEVILFYTCYDPQDKLVLIEIESKD